MLCATGWRTDNRHHKAAAPGRGPIPWPLRYRPHLRRAGRPLFSLRHDSFPGHASTEQEAVMFISDVLRVKGREVVRIQATDNVDSAVHKLAERRIGALVVEDRWRKPVGIFSERDFIKATAHDGAEVLGYEVRQLM